LVVTSAITQKRVALLFPTKKQNLHIGFDDPDGKDYKEFQKTFTLMRDKFLPIIKDTLAIT